MTDKELYGWWGKYAKDGKAIQWIGPMTREEMQEKHDTYRHLFRETPPETLVPNL